MNFHIHTFTYQKTLPPILLLLVFKIDESGQCVLKASCILMSLLSKVVETSSLGLIFLKHQLLTDLFGVKFSSKKIRMFCFEKYQVFHVRILFI